MALVQVTKQDKIEIVDADSIPMIQVRSATWVEDDVTGEIIGGKQFSRYVVDPNTDTTTDTPLVKSIANTVHTAQVRSAYQAKLNANANAPI